MGLENITIASPDVGGTKRANTYARMLQTDMVICHKTRAKANEVNSMTVIGDVKGKDVIIVDDMIDTAGTITKAANLMKKEGARSVRAFAAHGVLSGPAVERIERSSLGGSLFYRFIAFQNRTAIKLNTNSCRRSWRSY
jgi:ribose-phosphate pyrophosphokinase